MTTQPEATTHDDDLNWVYTHMTELGEYSGEWIAVLDHKVIARGATGGDVVDHLDERNINGALLFQMPADVHRRLYLIG